MKKFQRVELGFVVQRQCDLHKFPLHHRPYANCRLLMSGWAHGIILCFRALLPTTIFWCSLDKCHNFPLRNLVEQRQYWWVPFSDWQRNSHKEPLLVLLKRVRSNTCILKVPSSIRSMRFKCSSTRLSTDLFVFSLSIQLSLCTHQTD